MIRAIEIFAVIFLVVMGLSHVVQPRAWARFFVALRAQGETGVFAVGFLSLAFGAPVAAFHPVWSGVPLLLTLLGWAQVLKALLYFTLPTYGARKLALVDPERPWMFVIPGVALLAIAAVLGADLLRS